MFHEGQWGTVCDDGWDLNEAAVVCRQLGCGRATAAYSRARFGQGTGNIWLDDMSCTGTEDNLAHCQARPWGQSNCNHGEDAGVVCSGTSHPVTQGTGGEHRRVYLAASGMMPALEWCVFWGRGLAKDCGLFLARLVPNPATGSHPIHNQHLIEPFTRPLPVALSKPSPVLMGPPNPLPGLHCLVHTLAWRRHHNFSV